MMETWTRQTSLLLAGMVIISGLVAFSTPVLADEDVTIAAGSGETYMISYDDANMISHAGVAAADEQIQINELGDGTANTMIYLGEDEATLQFTLTISADPGEDTLIALQGTGVVSVGDDNGEEFLTGVTPLTFTVIFTIDTADTGAVEELYPLTCRITEETNGNSASIGIQIYVASIVHDDGTSDQTRDTAHAFEMDPATGGGDYIKDHTAGGDYPLEAGDDFKEVFFDLNNNAPYTVTDPKLNLTAPTGITLIRTYAQFVGDVASGADEDLLWRVNVAAGLSPGVYHGTAVLTYIRATTGADVPISETGRSIDYTVDFSFKDNDPMVDGEPYSEYQCCAANVEIINYTRQDDYAAPAIGQGTDETTGLNTTGGVADSADIKETGGPQRAVGIPVWAWGAIVAAVALGALAFAMRRQSRKNP